MTLSVWLDITRAYYLDGINRAVLGLAADKGYYFELGNTSVVGPDLIRFATDHKLSPDSLGLQHCCEYLYGQGRRERFYYSCVG